MRNIIKASAIVFLFGILLTSCSKNDFVELENIEHLIEGNEEKPDDKP